MKLLFYIVIGLFLIMSLLFVALSIASRKQPELGLLDAQLRPCPRTSNCVCSEQQAGSSFVEP